MAAARFRRSPLTVAANLFTLALGLACFTAAWGAASYWRSADSSHPGADRIVYISQQLHDPRIGAGGPPPIHTAARLGADLPREFPELEAVARIGQQGEAAVAANGAKAYLPSVYADPEIFDILDFTFVEGSAAAALLRPSDVVITQSAARRLFGDGPALGARFRVDDSWDAVVAGVVAPLPQPSFLGDTAQAPMQAQLIFPMSRFEQIVPPAIMDDYGALTFTTLARLPETLSLDAFAGRLEDMAARKPLPVRSDESYWTVTPHPLSTLMLKVLDSQVLGGGAFGLSIAVVLPLLGLVILLVASVNYAGLATTQAIARSKESSMRTVLGASRADLYAQHAIEALLTASVALAVALVALAVASPAVQSMSGIDLLSFLGSMGSAAAFLAGLVVATGLVTAAYPALRTSRVRPVEALGSNQSALRSSLAARIFVTIQFLSASFLLIVVAVMQIQQAQMRDTVLGDDTASVMMLGPLDPALIDFDVLEARLTARPEIESVTLFERAPFTGSGNRGDFGLADDAGAAFSPIIIRPVGMDFFRTFDRQILAGRVFDRQRNPAPDSLYRGDASGPAPVVLDATAAQTLGFATPQDAVGQIVYRQIPRGPDRPPAYGRALEVIGVVEADTWHLGLGPRGSLYHFDPVTAASPPAPAARVPGVRFAPGDVASGVAAVTEVWDELAPNLPIRMTFFDEAFEASLADYNRIQRTFAVLAACAFVISTFGILGVAVYAAQRRRREVGIRKTLGASTARVLRLLLVDFSKPVVIGNLVAWPLAWMAAESYLGNFADRAPLTPFPFVLCLGFTLVVAWLAVGGQAWKAATVNPASVLKYE